MLDLPLEAGRRRVVAMSLVLPALLLVSCVGGEEPEDVPGKDEEEILGSLSTVPPEVGGSREIELDLSTVTGAERMRFVERPGDLEEVGWVSFSPSLPWTLSEGDGIKTIDGELANEHGGYLRVETSVRLIESPPTGSFTINGGAPYSDSPQVWLDLAGIRGADVMRFALEPEALSTVEWIDYRERLDYTVGAEEVLHTVHGEFKDALDRVHRADASITLMPAAPGGSFVIDGGATHTNHPDRLVVLDFSGIRGAIELRVANSEAELESEPFVEMVETMQWTLSEGEGLKSVHAELRSPFDVTNVATAQIVYDVTPPPVPQVFAPARTGNRRPTWVFESEGADRYRLSPPGSDEWIETTETSYVPVEPLPTCNGEHGLRVAAGDEAGNWSPEIEASVFVYCVVAGTVSLHDPSGGDLFIVLLDEQEYTTGEVSEETDRWAVVPASEGRFRFEDVPDGEWIILGFQDDDGNGELTLGLFGAPNEAWGTYEGESYASLVAFADGHFVVNADGREGIDLAFSGFSW